MIDDLRARLSPTAWRAGHWLMRHVVARAPGGAFAWRVFDLFQKEGAGGVARRVTRKLGFGSDRRRTVEKLRAIAGSPRRPVVLTPTVDWEITLFQRPQQMALALGALGVPCLYVTTNQAAGDDGLSEVAPGCFLVDDLALCTETLDRFTLVVFSTSPEKVRLEDLRPAAARAVVVYDLVDEIHTDIYAISPSMEARHDAMVRDADLVSVTADRLADQVRAVREKAILLNPNAGDVEHFRPRAGRAVPPELARLLDEKRPIVGYYGAIASWFDFALVRRIAVARPDLQIVLVGVDYDGSLGRSGLQKLPNLRMLGPRDYRVLPDYLACFDVATIPFLKNEITESTSPIKLFEYMAAQKPIVTTDLRECRKYSSVMIGRDHDEFLAQLDRALLRRRDPDYLALLDREANANSWRRRAESLLDEVERIAVEKWRE